MLHRPKVQAGLLNATTATPAAQESLCLKGRTSALSSLFPWQLLQSPLKMETNWTDFSLINNGSSHLMPARDNSLLWALPVMGDGN